MTADHPRNAGACRRQPLAPRRQSPPDQRRWVPVGGDAPVSVQSMTTTLTADVNATLQQIAELTASGCQIVRVAVPSQDDADALPAIATQVADPGDRRHPLPAEVRLRRDRRRLRGGAGQPGQHQAVRRQGQARSPRPPRTPACRSGSASTPARWTSGCWRSTARPRPRRWSSRRCGSARCSRSTASATSRSRSSTTTRSMMIQAYRQLAEQCDYPLHLGVTEAGPAFQGTIKSAVAFGALLAEGIGDTIRVSLSAPPVEEVKVGNAILESLGTAPARPGDRLLPVLRPGPGRRLHARRAR